MRESSSLSQIEGAPGSGLGSRRFKSCRPDHHQTRLVELNTIGTNSGWVVGWADLAALAGAAGKARRIRARNALSPESGWATGWVDSD